MNTMKPTTSLIKQKLKNLPQIDKVEENKLKPTHRIQ